MQYQNYIGGKWQSAQSGQTFPNYNPATGEILGYFPLSGEAEANAAVAAARAAFEKWRLVPAPKRGEILYRVGELLKERSEEHTSELQSHLNLVCRLLLEKKTTKTNRTSCHRFHSQPTPPPTHYTTAH